MAVDMFIKLEGIKGEAQDHKHKNEIDVLSWSWGVSNSGSSHTGGGGGAGKASFRDLSFTKYVDLASADLYKFCSTGQHVKLATLVVRKAGGEQQEYLKYELKDCLISAISTGGSGGEENLTENVTLNFAQINVEYKPQESAGGLGGVSKYGYNIKENKVA